MLVNSHTLSLDVIFHCCPVLKNMQVPRNIRKTPRALDEFLTLDSVFISSAPSMICYGHDQHLNTPKAICIYICVCVSLTRSATGDLRCSCTCLSTSTCIRAMGRARARAPRASSSSLRCSRQNSPSSSSSSQVSRSERDELCLLCTAKK